MPANGRRQTYAPEDAAVHPIAASARVVEVIRAAQQPGEMIDDTLRRLLGLEPRKVINWRIVQRDRL